MMWSEAEKKREGELMALIATLSQTGISVPMSGEWRMRLEQLMHYYCGL